MGDDVWTVVGSRSVRSAKEAALEEKWEASRRSLDGGIDRGKIGQPVRLQVQARARQATGSGDHTRGVVYLQPAAQAHTISLQPSVRRKEKPVHDEVDLGCEEEWPTISERADEQVASQVTGSPWSVVVSTPHHTTVKQEAHFSGDRRGGESRWSAGGVEKDGNSVNRKKRKTKPLVAQEDVRQPLTLEFGSMFEALKGGKGSVRMVLGGGVLPSRSSAGGTTTEVRREAERPRNALDSSAPTVRRGKEREGPQRKKASALRKVIEREKAEKKGASSKGCAELKVTPVHSIHNRRFREYCSHLPSEAINSAAQELLGELLRFQDRQFHRDPVKAKAKRRYVCGLREVKKHLELRKLKCVIVAPNLDRIQSPGGIDDITGCVLSLCEEQGVTTVFALSRRRLGWVLRKSHKVGCVGIFNYSGAETQYKRMMELVSDAKEQYRLKLAESEPQGTESPESPSDDDELPNSPWDLFLPQSTSSAVEPPTSTESFKLNIFAPEFVPTLCVDDHVSDP